MNRTFVALLASSIAATTACAAVLGIEDFEDVGAGAASPTGTQTGTAGSGGSGAFTPTGTGSGVGGSVAFTWQHDWSAIYGGDGDASAKNMAVAAQSSNRIVIVGSYTGSIDFGGSTIESQEIDIADAYVALFSQNGDPQWTRRLGSYEYDLAESVTFDPASDVIVTGTFRNHFEVHAPGGPHWDRGQNQGEIFVVKLASDGDYRWCNIYGDTLGNQIGLGVATDTAANVFVTGRFNSTVDFGPVVRNAQDTDAFILELTSGGDHVMDAQLGESGAQRGYDVAVDEDGLPIVVGANNGSMPDGVSTAGGWDVFLAKHAADGSHDFVLGFGDGEDEQANAVATDGTDFVVAGQFRGVINLGEGQLPSQGSLEAFVARFSGNGDLTWSLSLGSAGDDVAHDVAVSEDGLIAVTGQVTDDVTFGDCVWTGSDPDVFVLVLDGAGSTVWCERFGGEGAQEGRAVAWDSTGAIVLHGDVKQTINFGGEHLVATDSTQDVFVARFERVSVE